MGIMQERRFEVRMMCADMVEVCWTNRSGVSRRTMALLEDISPSGACLQVETSVPVGARIRWDSPRKGLSGVVRYCVYREIGYFVGVEFDPSSKWSKKVYKPQHLLDLKRLMQRSKAAGRTSAKPLSPGFGGARPACG
jgi:hypothetical protein